MLCGITADALTATTPVSTPLINFDGLITSTGAVTLNATDINILGGVTARGQNVTLDAGTSGVEISGGAINTSGDAAAIGGIIDIDSEGDVEITGVDSDLITSGGAAAGAAGFAGGAVTIDATGTGSITIGTGVDITTTGSAAAAGAGGAGGLVSMDTANQTITLTDTLITTSGGAGVGGAVGAGGAITFGSDVVNDSLVLATNGALDTVAMDAGANSANIIFNTTVEGPAGLTLTSGITGDIEFNGVVGANTVVGQVQINEARNVDVNQNFTSTGFNQATSGVGTFTAAADATLTTTTNSLTIDSETVTLNGNLRTNAGAANGLIDLNAGAGGLTQAVDTSITSTSTTPGTASGAIDIDSDGDIALNGSVISTGADNNNGAGGDGGESAVMPRSLGHPQW